MCRNLDIGHVLEDPIGPIGGLLLESLANLAICEVLKLLKVDGVSWHFRPAHNLPELGSWLTLHVSSGFSQVEYTCLMEQLYDGLESHNS